MNGPVVAILGPDVPDPVAVATAAAAGGATLIQWRDKTGTTSAQIAMVRALQGVTEVPVFVTDRADVAALPGAGRLSPSAAATLTEAHALQARLQQIVRVAMDGRVDADTAGRGLMDVLCAAAGASGAPSLEARLAEVQAAAAAQVDALLPDAPSPGAEAAP